MTCSCVLPTYNQRATFRFIRKTKHFIPNHNALPSYWKKLEKYI